MKTLSILIITLFLSLNLFCQDEWKQWDPEIIKIANTAVNSDYMTEEEKNVILISNLARYDGQFFAESFLNEFRQD